MPNKKQQKFLHQLKISVVLMATLLSLVTPCLAKAQQRLSLMMDAESLQWIKDAAQPLMKVANIPADQVDFFVVNNNDINAFVNEKNNMFIYSGLILKAETPEEVLGVIAHELGHVQGKHIFSRIQNNNKYIWPTVVSGILGVGAAALGSSQAAAALMVGGQALSTSTLLRHTQTDEREADQRAFKILYDAGYSANGMVSFFSKLKGTELYFSNRPAEYLLTHPYTEGRKQAAEAFIAQHTRHNTEAQPPSNESFKLMQARLFALTNSKGKTLRKYMQHNTLEATYALAIANALTGDLATAQTAAENLISQRPENPYFYELLGFVASQKGDISTAENLYAKALALVPRNSLLRLQLAQYETANNHLAKAITNLNVVVQNHANWADAWRMLGIAYGKQGNFGESHLALAEQALLENNKSDAKLHLNTAEKHLQADGKSKQLQRLAELRDIIAEEEK